MVSISAARDQRHRRAGAGGRPAAPRSTPNCSSATCSVSAAGRCRRRPSPTRALDRRATLLAVVEAVERRAAPRTAAAHHRSRRRSARSSWPSDPGCSCRARRPSSWRSSRSTRCAPFRAPSRSPSTWAPAAGRSPWRSRPRCRTRASRRRELAAGLRLDEAELPRARRVQRPTGLRRPRRRAARARRTRSTSSSPTRRTSRSAPSRATPRCGCTTRSTRCTAATTGWTWCVRFSQPGCALLRAGGTLVLEHGELQGQPIRDLLAADGWRAVATHRDLLGRDRATTALR